MGSPGEPARRSSLPFLGLACAVGVSSIYYNQPLLLEMSRTFGSTPGRTGFVATATQVGYALGLLLLVPLGDVLERRGLMMRMYGGAAVALLLVAVAPSLGWLMAGSVLIGVFAAVTHVVLPIAPELAADEDRGRAIGVVMTGLLLGILLARTFSGWVSRIGGWRYVFVVAAVLNLAFVPLLWKRMPKLPARQALGYGDAMRSLGTLFREQPLLRESGVIAALCFGSFSCFWTTLAFLLHSRYGLGPGVAGTFGLVGAVGAVVAPRAGKAADRRGPRFMIGAGIACFAMAYGVLWGQEKIGMPTGMHLVALALGVVVLDLAAQLTQIGNQTRIFGLVEGARSRLNTVYMTMYFSGAAAGSALATVAWTHWKWDGVCALALGLVGAAGLRQMTGRSSGEGCVPLRADGAGGPVEV